MVESFVHALYIDPTAVSITLTSIFGAALVIGTSLTIWWRKAKKKVAKTFHIDENAHKEVEEELVIHDEEIDDGKAGMKNTASETDAAAKETKEASDSSSGDAKEKEESSEKTKTEE